jgi:hypothetical protein
VNTARTSDDGITLVEMLVTSFVATLFLGMLALLFANGIQAQAQTTDRDTATGKAGVLSNSVLTSIRNASVFTVTDSGRGLIAKVATGATGWQCRAWFPRATATCATSRVPLHSPPATRRAGRHCPQG